MRSKILFLVIMLALGCDCLAVTVTIQQANSIIQTGSASTSGSNFFNILAGSLSSDMTQTNFAGYYAPNFVSTYTQAEYQELLNNYLSDITSSDYTQAQIDLIKLAAATFKNGNKPFVSTVLTSATSPWPVGGKLFVIASGVPLNQTYLQFFVDQFALVYAKLPTNSNDSPTQIDFVTPVNPSQKVADPTIAMQLEASNDDSVMDSIVNAADPVLNSAVLDLERQMNDLFEQAKSNPNIKDAATNQGYITQLQNLVQQAETGSASTSLQSIVSGYQQQIANAAATGVKNLGVLAEQGTNTSSLLAAYIQNLNLKSSSDQAAIVTALDQSKDTIDNLQNSIQDSITGMIANVTPGGLPDWINDLLKGAVDAGVSATIAIALYCSQLLLCKYGMWWKCPPIRPDIVEKLNLPDNINDLLTKLNLNTVSDLLDKSAITFDQLSSSLEGVLGLETGTVKSLIGTAITDKGQAMTEFMTQVSTVKSQIVAQVENISPEVVLKAVGQALKAKPSSLSDITDLIVQVKATLTGSAPSNSGTGNDMDNIPGATAFDNLEYDITQTTLQQTLFDNIKSLKLSLADFKSQIEDLKSVLDSDQDLSEAERAAITEKINAGENIIDQATNAPQDPDKNPFVEGL